MMQSRVRRKLASVVMGFLLIGGLMPLFAQPGQRGGDQTAPSAMQAGRGGQQTRRDAREDAPEALIGTWVQNIEKSHYDPGPPLKSQVASSTTRETG
jgi:hypothetical protein